MFTKDFDATAALAGARCSRWDTIGLVQAHYEAYRTAPAQDRREPGWTMSPSLYATCPACGLIGEWPEMAGQ